MRQPTLLTPSSPPTGANSQTQPEPMGLANREAGTGQNLDRSPLLSDTGSTPLTLQRTW